jgi:plasmid stability protein
MPTNITIRDIPDEIYQRIKYQAELHHRSINSELIVNLKRSVKAHRKNPNQIIAKAKKLKQQAKGSLSMDEIQKAIGEGRP